jgi:low temperature requirement protein LtrA
VAVRQATEAGGRASSLAPIVLGGLLIVFSFWWLYFERPAHEMLNSLRRAFVWGYGHYFVFGSAAAVGAGLAVAVDQAIGRSHVSGPAAGAAVAVPAAVYLSCLFFLHARETRTAATRVVAPLAIVLVLLSPLSGHAVLGTGLLMAGLTVFKIAQARRATAS